MYALFFKFSGFHDYITSWIISSYVSDFRHHVIATSQRQKREPNWTKKIKGPLTGSEELESKKMLTSYFLLV